MSLAPGVRLQGYEIVALLGAGGMGEVYRALDTRLNREVALKVLPERTAGDDAAYARFTREAQAVAALSHPNILAVHDVGRTEVAAFAVFELLQGASLRERLAQGALPLRKAVDYARQAADGLGAAHARGITHRDVKPDNLFITDDGRLKILDFGLAQAQPGGALADARTGIETAAPLTGEGAVLGTVGYMAPEQVRGQAVDSRADLFALGATLYEMCTGQRAFKGTTAADTVAAVLSSDPPEMGRAGAVPPALERIVRRCLEKQPAERFQSARDLSFALDALATLSSTSGPAADVPVSRSGRWPVAVLGAFAAAALGLMAGRASRPAVPVAVPAPSLRATLPALPGPVGRVLPSPDGRYLLVSERTPESLQLQVVLYTLASGAAVIVPRSVGAMPGTWSPRSDEFIIAADDGELRRVRVADMTATPFAKADGPRRAMAWLSDDTVVFTPVGARSLARIPATGGAATPIVKANGDNAPFMWLSRIGDRTDVVMGLLGPGGGAREIVSVALATGETKVVAPSAFEPVLAMGRIFTARATGLFAARFDTARLAIDGEFVQVGDSVGMDATTALASFGVSEAGLLAFRPGRSRNMQFQWLDAGGLVQESVGEPGDYSGFDLSPDGSRIVTRLVAAKDDQPTNATLRVIDMGRGVTSAVSIPAGPLSDPIWTADGTRVLYRLGSSLLRQSPLGQTRDVVADTATYPDHASPDGRWLIVGRPLGQGGFALFVLASDGHGTPLPLAGAQPFVADEGRFSPDGRLIAFQSTQSGRNEIYLARFPFTDERWQVSSSGGVQARWAPDGRSLYYLSLTGRLMRVPVEPGAPDRVGRPRELFDLGVGAPSSIFEQYAVHGDRFLVLRPVNDDKPMPTVVINNWWPDVLPASTGSAQPRP